MDLDRAAAFSDKTAVVGIGYSRDPVGPDNTGVFSKNSGVSPFTLALRAAGEAARDAGLDPAEIDGGVMRHIAGDSAAPAEVLRALGSRSVSMSVQLEPGTNYSTHALMVAAMAVHQGLCNYVIVYRAMNGCSGMRVGTFKGPRATRIGGPAQFTAIYGMGTPPQSFAMRARRYMELYGVTTQDLGTIAVNSRRNAQLNPRAMMYGRPMTLEDHQNSRMVADPYHLFDCCLETDVGACMLVTTVERARDLKKTPVLISGSSGTGEFPQDVLETPMKSYTPRLLAAAGIDLKDIDLAQFYDNFSDSPMRMIEDMGFCHRGEAKDFIKADRIALDGDLPIQTAGGLMSEGYGHGMSNALEAVQQVRGEAEDLCPDWRKGIHTFDRTKCRQVRRHDIALHTSPTAAAAVILKRG